MHSLPTGKRQCHYGKIMQPIATYDLDETIARRATFGPFLANAQEWSVLDGDESEFCRMTYMTEIA